MIVNLGAITKEKYQMGRVREYILNELRVIERECLEKGISASEWVERYAAEYRRRYGNGSMQRPQAVNK